MGHKAPCAFLIPTASAGASLSCALKTAASRKFLWPSIIRKTARGLGVADMAKALRTGRACRADCSQTLHVLEIMTAFEKSSLEGRYLELETTYERGPAMAHNPVRGILD